MSIKSPGKSFREAVNSNNPLAVLGVINAYSALQATKLGAKAIYLSGSGVASASYGLPDLGIVGRCLNICKTHNFKSRYSAFGEC